MEIVEELSRVEFDSVLLRELIIDCDIHGRTKHLDLNGHISCYQCSEDNRLVAAAKRLTIDLGVMKALMAAKMTEKGVSVNMGRFSDWQYDKAKNTKQRDTIAELQEYSKSVNGCSQNVIILGPTGTGKTMLANAIAVNHYLKKEKSLPSGFDSYNKQGFYDHTCQLITSFDIGSQVKACWGNYQANENNYLRNLVANELLIIDDLGASDGYVKDRERIAQIINLRYKKAPTVITTNMNIAGVREFLGDRAWDRLRESLLVVTCDWESYRAKNAIIRVVGSTK